MLGVRFGSPARRPRRLTAWVIGTLGFASLTGAIPADAAFVQQPPLPEGALTFSGAFATSSDALLVVTRSQAAGTGLSRSVDAGASWQPVPAPEGCTPDAISIAGDGPGAFAVAIVCKGPPVPLPERQIGVWRLPAGSGLQALGTTDALKDFGASVAIAPDGIGGLVVATTAIVLTGQVGTTPGNVTVRRFNAAGTLVATDQLGQVANTSVTATLRGAAVWIRAGESEWTVTGGAAPVAADPALDLVAARGPLRFRADGKQSVNSGASWTDSGFEALKPVPGTDLVVRRGQFQKPWNEALYVATDLTAPPGFNGRYIAEGAHLYALGRVGSSTYVLFRHDGPINDAGSRGALEADTVAMVGQANALRAEAGFPPLVGDPLISAASRNHSKYWTVNEQPNEILDLHSETAGKPGFTGSSPGERCSFVGTSCGSEIMHSINTPKSAVIDWMATTYHRQLIGDPVSRVVGGAIHGTSQAVMNGNTDGDGLQIMPLGYPNGRYSGGLSFSGEAPDPREACKSVGQPITSMGATVTLYPPLGTTGVTTLTLSGPAGPVRGCALLSSFDSHFIPDGALKPKTTYAASATFDRGAGPETHNWSFTTGTGNFPDEGGESGPKKKAPKVCRTTFSVATYYRRPARSVRVRVRPCAGVKTIRATLYRANGRRAVTRVRSGAKVGKKGFQSVYLRPRALRPGAYVVKVRVGADRYTKRIRVTR